MYIIFSGNRGKSHEFYPMLLFEFAKSVDSRMQFSILLKAVFENIYGYYGSHIRANLQAG